MEDRQTFAVPGLERLGSPATLFQELTRAGIHRVTITRGWLTLSGLSSLPSLEVMDTILERFQVRRLDPALQCCLEQTKTTIEGELEQIWNRPIDWPNMQASLKAQADPQLQELFVLVEGVSFEKYLRNRRMDQLKQLLVYTDWEPAFMAERLGYASAFQLEDQLVTECGLPITHFRAIRREKQSASERFKKASRPGLSAEYPTSF
ncbi:helix-turn-helix domain-containing protein [Larkinella insperata]|uniref:Helix-turn-helix domain-containing protein n=1 Tax=Larkinella insperata TaxID=332158 RepID=A0ABW3QG32_9BACT